MLRRVGLTHHFQKKTFHFSRKSMLTDNSTLLREQIAKANPSVYFKQSGSKLLFSKYF